VAGLGGVVGITLYSLSKQSSPASTLTRREAIDEAQLHFVEDRLGLGFLAGAAALAVTAGVIALVYRHDIFGETVEERPKKAKRALWTPTVGGLMVRW